MRAFAARGSIISSNDGGTRSVNLDISGPDLVALYAVAQAAFSRAETVFDNPRVQSQPSSLSLAHPLLQIKPDFDRVAEVGMTTEDIGFAVAALTDGAFVNEFFLDDDKIDMYLYNQQGPNATLETLNNITLQTPVGETLLLSELVTIEETVDTSTLNIIPSRSVTLETGVAKVREEVESRLRPIAISSITTICGLAPLVFLPGAGSELYRGVGVIAMAGIIGATLVTLTMLPALTVMVLQWTQRQHKHIAGQTVRVY